MKSPSPSRLKVPDPKNIKLVAFGSGAGQSQLSMIVMLIDDVSTVSGMDYQDILGRVAETECFHSRLGEFFLFCVFFFINNLNASYDSTNKCPNGNHKSENRIRHGGAFL